MGCGSSRPPTTSYEVAQQAVSLALSRGMQLSHAQARIGARFCPGRSAAEVLDWLEDPMLIASVTPPEHMATETFELSVPPELQQQTGVRIMTTIVLPAGKRVAVTPGEGILAAETMSVCIPIVALNSVGQWTLDTWTTEDEIEATRQRANVQAGPKCPLTLAELEEECPLITVEDVPATLRGTDTCGVCQQELFGAGPKLPLRQLPCAHAFHCDCVDPWLTAHERTCPMCRLLVLPELRRAPLRVAPLDSDEHEADAEPEEAQRDEPPPMGHGAFGTSVEELTMAIGYGAAVHAC